MLQFRTPEWVICSLKTPNILEKLSTDFIEKLKLDLGKFSVENPLVSIVIPVYNEELNLIQTLHSLSRLNLRYPTELIVINNNSNDKTQHILDLLNVKSYFLEKRGISYARQRGLEVAKGKYHLCADGDSLYPEEWANEYVEALKDKNISVVYGSYSFLPLMKCCNRKVMVFYEAISGLLFRMRRRNKEYLNVLGFNFAFRTEDAKKIGGFNTSRPRWSDGWMAMCLQELGRIQYISSDSVHVWTDARRLKADGNLFRAIAKRVAKERVNFTSSLKKRLFCY